MRWVQGRLWGGACSDSTSPAVRKKRLRSTTRHRTFAARGRGPGSCDGYKAMVLDDPAVSAGKHKLEMNFPGIRQSIIPFIRKSRLEEDLNSLFREKHPNLPSTLTLTTIRKLKKRMLQAAMELSLNFCTIAYAYAFFERLIFLQRVSRDNAKVRAAVCLVL